MTAKLSKFLISAVLLSFIAALVIWWASLPDKKIAVTIPQGASAGQIAAILSDAKIIQSRVLFRSLVYISSNSGKLKAGTYFFSQRNSVFEVLRKLASGQSSFVKITIPEGFTSEQIAQRLEKNGVCAAPEFLAAARKSKSEGYLFPETYFFEPNTSPEKIIEVMRAQFDKNFPPDFEKRLEELKMTKNSVVTLASIIEKEAVLPEERPVISSVFHNRLKKHWYLESCATVLYALGQHKEKLTYKDLRVDSPYNTYRHFGLPPGPICSPGLGSLRAALYPQKSDDMFFVVSSSGSHAFSRYLEEHIKNKALKKKADRLKRNAGK